MPDISSRTFKIVRKGLDPDEVRRYLTEVQSLVNALEAGPPTGAGGDAQAEQLVAAARAQAEQILAEANRTLEDARKEQAAKDQALQTWLGPDGTPAPDAPGTDVLGDAALRADEIVAAAQARADELIREAEGQAQAVDRWDGLGEHVARIVSQAEEEAKAIVADARTAAESTAADAELQRFQLTSAASADRDEAAAVLERARAQAAELTGRAEAEAEAIRAQAEPRALAHIDQVLSGSRSDLDAVRRDLEVALDQLQDVQRHVGNALAHRPGLPEFYAAERFLNGAAVAPSGAAVTPHAAFQPMTDDELGLTGSSAASVPQEGAAPHPDAAADGAPADVAPAAEAPDGPATDEAPAPDGVTSVPPTGGDIEIGTGSDAAPTVDPGALFPPIAPAGPPGSRPPVPPTDPWLAEVADAFAAPSGRPAAEDESSWTVASATEWQTAPPGDVPPPGPPTAW